MNDPDDTDEVFVEPTCTNVFGFPATAVPPDAHTPPVSCAGEQTKKLTEPDGAPPVAFPDTTIPSEFD